MFNKLNDKQFLRYNNSFNNFQFKSCEEIYEYKCWSKIPYKEGFIKPLEPSAGYWPMKYFIIDSNNNIIRKDGKRFNQRLKEPIKINFEEELQEVIYINKHITSTQVSIANYWGEGVPANQWSKIALELINTYNISPPKSARILSSLESALYDAFVITWYYKYLYNVARPIQLDINLQTIIPTPKFPTYPSGHSVIGGTAEVILSYFFENEARKLKLLAEEASISRLYGGVHFRSDLDEGIELGRKIGKAIVDKLKKELDSCGKRIDEREIDVLNANILPDYKR